MHQPRFPQTFYDAIYKDPLVFKEYHRDINKCDGAEVTPWADGQRVVSFGLALTIPTVVKKLVGEQLGGVRGGLPAAGHPAARPAASTEPAASEPGARPAPPPQAWTSSP
jgi:hypothetical protein